MAGCRGLATAALRKLETVEMLVVVIGAALLLVGLLSLLRWTPRMLVLSAFLFVGCGSTMSFSGGYGKASGTVSIQLPASRGYAK